MLHTLTMLVCLASVPASCEVQEMVVEELSSHPSAAFVQAQALVASWVEQHPQYIVRRWLYAPAVRHSTYLARRRESGGD
jgi:hypothetical protein